jgi:adenylate cyclase
MSGDHRQLAAMMLTDMVGYSALTQRDERRALVLLREQERLVRPILRSFRGWTVKSLGDGFLVEFASALDAVRCAVEIQKTLGRRNARAPGESIELRIGVHLGDVVHRGQDVFGDAVNIVARIEPLADPGGICISQQVYDQVRRKLDAPFVAIGSPELKNITDSIALYRLALPSSHPAPPAPPQDRPRVAVLPLANISGHAEDEYFADGITEELIQRLSGIGGLGVIARTSMMRFKRAERSPAQIARELGAKVVVEGGVQKVGAQVRVMARLIDASTEETLWSQTYDREFRDVFDLQSDISRRIAESLQVKIVSPEQRALDRPWTPSPGAHSFYLKGRYFLNQRTEDSLRQALDNFRSALRQDGRLAQAHAGIADAYSLLAWLEFLRPRHAFPRARAAAERALALDPAVAEAHTSLAFVRFLYDRDWVTAESEFRRSIALNPNYPTAHQFYSDFLKAMGRLDEALTEIHRALELDPLSLSINTAVGHVLYLSRQYDPAIAQYQKALELDPNFAQAHLWFGRPFLEKGQFDRAIEELELAARISRNSTMSLAVLGHAYASAGRKREATGVLNQLRARGRTQYVPSYWIALVYVGLDDRDRAFEWLGRAERERSAWLAWVKVEPRFDGVRSDPRFGRLLRRLRLS